MKSKTFYIAHREYMENVRTKTFWISMLILPILIAISFGISALLNRFKEVQRYTVIDPTGGALVARAEREARQGDLEALMRFATSLASDPELQKDPAFAELKQTVQVDGTPTPGPEQMQALLRWMQKQDPKELAKLQGIATSRRYQYVPLADLGLKASDLEGQKTELGKLVHQGKLFAYFVLGTDPLKSFADFTYVSNNLTDKGLQDLYETTLTAMFQKDRIAAANIDPKIAKHIQERVRFEPEQTDEAGKTSTVSKEDTLGKWAPMGFVYFLWFAIFGITNLLLTNTIEEKSNRIIEVLLSSVSPGELMRGKIFGIAATGLTIIGTWVVFGLLAAEFAPKLLGSEGTMVKFLVATLQNSGYLVSFVAYFLSGYLLYAAVLVAIGSVCNSLKEAQNLMQPVMMILMVPLIAMVFVTQEPNGTVAKVLSFVPLYTPFTMMNRAGGPPETWEYVATSALIVVSILVAFHAAGKIFRIGVLMTGNPPKLKEILGWLREK